MPKKKKKLSFIYTYKWHDDYLNVEPMVLYRTLLTIIIEYN